MASCLPLCLQFLSAVQCNQLNTAETCTPAYELCCIQRPCQTSSLHTTPAAQHAPVYTLGKRGSSSDFHTAPEQLRLQGAEVHTADRGGEVTYHGPGQARPAQTSAVSTDSCGSSFYYCLDCN